MSDDGNGGRPFSFFKLIMPIFLFFTNFSFFYRISMFPAVVKVFYMHTFLCLELGAELGSFSLSKSGTVSTDQSSS